MSETNVRKAISARLRFEVFKRDGFACQYCGAHPPAVILHVDHLVPVAEGGPTEFDNLVTACEPCNLGKGARLLGDIPQSLADRAAEIAEREAQIAGYNEVIAGRRQRLDDDAWRVCDVYMQRWLLESMYRGAFGSVRLFVDKLGVEETVEAMEMACDRMGSASKAFRYFCGICWNKIRDQPHGPVDAE